MAPASSLQNRRQVRRLLALAAFGAVAGVGWNACRAQDTTANWFSETSGNWTAASLWSTNPNYPNNGTPSGTNYAAVISATGGTPYTVTLDSTITLDTLSIGSSDATLELLGTAANDTALQINTSMTNGGDLLLSDDGSGTAPALYGSGTLTNSSSGTLEAAAGGGGGRVIALPVDNQGTVTIDPGVTLSLESTAFTQESGGAINGGGTMSLMGGVLNLNATLNPSADLSFLAETVDGPGTLINSQTLTSGDGANFNASLDNRGTATVTSLTYLHSASQNENGATLNVEGTSTSGTANLSLSSTLTNDGTINLTDDGTANDAEITANGGTPQVTNNSDGTIAVHSSGGGSRAISGVPLANQGTLTIDPSATLAFSQATLTEEGTGIINGGGTLSLSSSTLTLKQSFDDSGVTLKFSGTTVNGTGTLVNAGGQTLNLGTGNTFDAGITNNGTATLPGGAEYFNGAITNNQSATLTIEGTSGNGTGNFYLSSTLSNSGTIELTDDGGGAGANIEVGSGTPQITNNSSGTLEATKAGGGQRVLAVPLVNNGTLVVQSGASLVASSTITNSGTIWLQGGSLSLSRPLNIGDGTLEGSGTIYGPVNLASDPSTLLFNLDGTTEGTQYNSLTVNGPLALAGDLSVALAAGFTPTPGDTFTVVNCDYLSGAFLNVASGDRLTIGNGGSFEVDYGSGAYADDVVLSNYQAPVPEPASISLIGVGGIMLMSRRRKRPGHF